MKWKSLHMPKGIEVDETTLTDSYGKFVLQPLERGFGITLGNALRRVLLSSIQGAAFESVLFESVHHEFSTLPGVVEDIPEIILNLKEVDVKLHAEQQIEVAVDFKGPPDCNRGRSRGGFPCRDRERRPPHLRDRCGRRVQSRMTINDGRGYVPADERFAATVRSTRFSSIRSTARSAR